MNGGRLVDLISVEDALNRILKSFSTKPAEYSHLLESYGRIVSQDISALTDLPPFTNSSMDGFAVVAEDLIHATQATPV